MREGGGFVNWIVEVLCLMVGEVLDYHSFDVARQSKFDSIMH